MILNLEQSMSTLFLCSNTEATNAQSPLNGANCGICPLSSPPRESVPLGISSGVTRQIPLSNTLKTVSVPNQIRALKAHCKFENHMTEINYR